MIDVVNLLAIEQVTDINALLEVARPVNLDFYSHGYPVSRNRW